MHILQHLQHEPPGKVQNKLNVAPLSSCISGAAALDGRFSKGSSCRPLPTYIYIYVCVSYICIYIYMYMWLVKLEQLQPARREELDHKAECQKPETLLGGSGYL